MGEEGGGEPRFIFRANNTVATTSKVTCFTVPSFKTCNYCQRPEIVCFVTAELTFHAAAENCNELQKS